MSIQKFETPELLVENLASNISSQLKNSIAERGRASIAVSGGSTPKRLFEALSHSEFDWSAITITLVDERWVSVADDRSNEKLVREFLMKDWARTAKFIPLFADAPTPNEGIPAVVEGLEEINWPLDVVVLGMGTDGHTASFFPKGTNLASALDPTNSSTVCEMEAPGAGEPRITLTLSKIAEAGQVYLHIEGKEKLAVLDKALTKGEKSGLPISTVFRYRNDIEVYSTE